MTPNRYVVLLAAFAVMSTSSVAYAAETGRRIEEVIVTAEKREATVSDTSISITAFGEEMIRDFGIQGADELVNFTPSTTRDAYDIRIRGVGRNFRALGGDPGVGTYYNGVYSEDFGIAASEGYLYDIERIEVLRGPQGTLYGRNSIGGALNYITNKPSYETEAEIRFLGGNLGAEEWYGVLSGPLIEDKLAYRFTGVRVDRDGSQDGLDGSEDVNTLADQNLALQLNWRVTDNIEWNIRYNDRDSDRVIGAGVLVNEGHAFNRGARDPNLYATGIVEVPAPVFNPFLPSGPGFVPYTGDQWDFTDPNTGAIVPGTYARPGVDIASTIRPNAAYGTNPDVLQPDIEDLGGDALTNNRNDETFNHNAVQTELSWDLNETTTLKFIGGWSDFDYTFFQDIDRSTSTLTQYHQRVIQSLENWSTELQLLWQLGDDLQLTSGFYYFDQDLRQQYSVNDDFNQGRVVNPANYGFLEPAVGFLFPTMARLGQVPMGTSRTGRWDGEPDGANYAIDNFVKTEAWAFYTQGTYTFNEEWALTVGARYAEDDKDAKDQRFAYIEVGFGSQDPFCIDTYGVPCATVGLTDLAVENMLMGNASFVPNLDPNNPITPTCALDDPNCATPLRLGSSLGGGVPLSFAAAAQDDDSWNDLNVRVNVDWTPNDSTLIYAGITTGYRAGGYSLGLLGTLSTDTASGVASPPQSYDDETVVAYEIGYKGSLFDDTLQLFSALYYYDYEGYQDQVDSFNPVTGGSDDIIINAGDAVNTGWEVEAVWLATDSWTIGGNYSYTKTEFKDQNLVAETDNPEYPNSLVSPPIVDLDGNDLKRIPEHKYTLYSYYDMNFPVGVLTFGGSLSYTGQFYDNSINRDLDRVRSRYRVDLSAIWRDNRDRWNIRAFVDNVTDEGVARGIGTAGAGQNWQLTGTYLYPRFYGVDVTYRFSHWL